MEEKVFEVSDLWLAAFLFACGLSPTLRILNGRVVFIFSASPDLDKLILNFQGNCNVRVMDYAAAAKTLRGQMLDMKNQRSNHG